MKDYIDKKSFVPAYYQLAQIIEQKINSGEFAPDERIPSETELGLEYGLSRMTVRKALELLIEKNILYAQQGKGTFVAKPMVDQAVFQINDFFADIKNQGMQPTVKLIEAKVVEAPRKIAAKLEVKAGQPVLFIRRLILADDEPQVYDRKYLIYDKSKPILEEELEYPTMPELLKNTSDVRPVRSQLTIEATIIRVDEAALLGVEPGSPAFLVEQHLFAANDKPMAWGWFIYRGDKYRFTSLARPL